MCCSAALFASLITQFSGAFNNSRMDVMAANEPGGTGVQNIKHWAQMARNDLFQMYDYGTEGNLQHYGQKTAPIYDISRYPTVRHMWLIFAIRLSSWALQAVPLAMYTGGVDELADPSM